MESPLIFRFSRQIDKFDIIIYSFVHSSVLNMHPELTKNLFFKDPNSLDKATLEKI